MKENDRVEEWEQGLPTPDELTPLGQSLITPELASAFSISRDSGKTASDVLQASMATMSTLRRQASTSGSVFDSIPAFQPPDHEDDEEEGTTNGERELGVILGNVQAPGQVLKHQEAAAARRRQGGGSGGGDVAGGVASGTSLPYSPYNISTGSAASDDANNVRKIKKPQQHSPVAATAAAAAAAAAAADLIEEEEGDSGGGAENSGGEEPAARTLKRPRLVWTPQLHKRFVDAVAHLGIKNAVPKTIMQLMNVEGLTRENVASHLQKYRLYLKRMQGLSSEGPSASDHLFASTPVPPGLAHFMNPAAAAHAAAAAAAAAAAHNRDDLLGGFSPPTPLVPAAAAFGPPRPYGFEHHPYGSMTRSTAVVVPPQQRLHTQQQGDMEAGTQQQGQAAAAVASGSSPPRQILTLFPTRSH